MDTWIHPNEGISPSKSLATWNLSAACRNGCVSAPRLSTSIAARSTSRQDNQDYSAKVARTPSELEDWIEPLVDAGVDLFDCSQRKFWVPEFEGSPLNLAGW